MKKLVFIASAILGASSVFAMDADGWASTYESLTAFESAHPRPGYVKPIIDNLGNVLNSNWYVSASVPQSFTFEAGIPISIIPIGNDDRQYTETINYMGVPFPYEAPTIFGGHHDMSQPYDGYTIYGNETLNSLGVFTYPYLQLGASFYHARVVFRGMFLPSISELRKFNLFGFGLQYSFGQFFQYMLPPAAQPLDVSLVFGYNTSGIGYRPEDYSGQLDLDVSTINFSMVIGYKIFNFIEVMMSLGYQSAQMKSSGQLIGTATTLEKPDYSRDYGKVINPDITVDGNNGFRFGLSIAFQLGKSFHPVVGYDYAGKSSFTTNILYFKQQFGEDKTPDEIAKEKGYVRGAKKAEEAPAEPAAEPAAEQVAEPVAEPAEEPTQEPESDMSDSAEESAAESAGGDFEEQAADGTETPEEDF